MRDLKSLTLRKYILNPYFYAVGEMELTSAVRSVSYKSDMNKCNGNLPKSNESENPSGGGNKVYIINIWKSKIQIDMLIQFLH